MAIGQQWPAGRESFRVSHTGEATSIPAIRIIVLIQKARSLPAKSASLDHGAAFFFGQIGFRACCSMIYAAPPPAIFAVLGLLRVSS